MRPQNFEAIAKLESDRKTSRRSQNLKAIVELQGGAAALAERDRSDYRGHGSLRQELLSAESKNIKYNKPRKIKSE